MPAPTLPHNLTPDDYAAIEGAVMETVRGRWFLMEFARRARVAELGQIRDAIAKLERTVSQSAETSRMPAVQLASPAPPGPAAEAEILPFEPKPPLSPLNQALEALSRFDRLAAEEKMALFG